MRIAVDVMGGDHGCGVVIAGAKRALEDYPSISTLFLVGQREEIHAALPQGGFRDHRVRVVHASEVLTMEDKPVAAVRRKRDASIVRAMELVSEGKADSLEHQETTRHLGFEFNGMRVHEYYFGNLGGKGNPDEAPDLKQLIATQYGSFDAWKQHFTSIGMTRGVGWAILYQDSMTGHLIDFWIDLHQANHPAGCAPILVMDVWEHAYMLDFGTKRADYIQAFFQHVNWPEAQKRVNFELVRQAQRA
mgnify:CR=1 FL=1